MKQYRTPVGVRAWVGSPSETRGSTADGGSGERWFEALREPCFQVVPAVETHLLVDAVPPDLGFVGRDLFRRPGGVLDLEDDPMTGAAIRERFLTEWTRLHFIAFRVIRT
jgi:hypothetical protein